MQFGLHGTTLHSAWILCLRGGWKVRARGSFKRSGMWRMYGPCDGYCVIHQQRIPVQSTLSVGCMLRQVIRIMQHKRRLHRSEVFLPDEVPQLWCPQSGIGCSSQGTVHLEAGPAAVLAQENMHHVISFADFVKKTLAASHRIVCLGPIRIQTSFRIVFEEIFKTLLQICGTVSSWPFSSSPGRH
eukprot:6291570-Amphidinium_carterae.1